MKKFSEFIICLILLASVFSACSQTSYYPPVETTPEEIPAPEIQEEITEPEQNIPKQPQNLQELISYLAFQREQGNLVCTVTYPTKLTDSEFDQLCSDLAIMHLSYTWQGNEYTFTQTMHPGNRIAQAHFTNDTSALSPDEIRVLEIARQMVATAQATTSDPIEQEILLHDMLAEKATYFRGSTDIPDVNNPPRHLTAVGAFIDGRANCQGYSDAFYTLATIAGFKVDRMSAFSDGEPHMVNTIFLDGAWYVVDATLHDSDSSGDSENLYYHFNAGLDMCGNLTWHPEAELKPIAKESNRNYYYYIQNESPRHNYNKVYSDISELADAAIYEFTQNNRNVVHMMISGDTATQPEIKDALTEAGKDVPYGFSYIYWNKDRGNNTYIAIKFSR